GVDRQVETRMHKVETQFGSQDGRNSKLEKQIAFLQKELHVVQNEPPPVKVPTPNSFDRPADPTIFVVRSKDLVTHTAARKAITPWFMEANLGVDDYQLNELPTGGRTDLYVSVDKSHCTIRRVLGTKIIRRKFETAYPDKRFYVDKDRGEVSLAWKKLIRYSPAPAGSLPTVEWNIPSLLSLGLDMRVLEARISAAFTPPAGDEDQ
ncbi:unnamed protein product, partial [Prorocentrum cordatum]